MDMNTIRKMIAGSHILIDDHGYNSQYEGQEFVRENHDFDLLLVIEGSYNFDLGKQKYTAEPMDLFLFPPDTTLHGTATASCYQIYLHFSLYDTSNQPLHFSLQDHRLSRKFRCYAETFRMNYERYHGNRQDYEGLFLIIKLIMMEIITSSSNNLICFRETNNFYLPDEVMTAKAIMDSCFTQDDCLEKAQKTTELSGGAFARLFSNHLGFTPAKYLEHLRMEYAKDYMRSSEGTVALIASELCFSDQFSFSKAFKRYTGYSPIQYRNLYRAINNQDHP